MKQTRSVFRVDVPMDIEDPAERVRLAFIAAEEAANDYVVPCSWEILGDDGEIVTVVRWSH